MLARTIRTNEAMAAFRRSGCSEADAHSNVAFALTLENSFKEAHEHFARARALDPASELAEDGLRVVNAQLNGPDKISTAAFVGSPKSPVIASGLNSPVAAPANQPPIIMQEPAQLPVEIAPPPVKINVGLEPPISTITEPPPAPQVIEMSPSQRPLSQQRRDGHPLNPVQQVLRCKDGAEQC